MTSHDPTDPRLSHLATPWTEFGKAHDAEGDPRLAQAKILFFYRPALLRYLTRLVGHADLAEELCQDFAVRFLRGDFRNVQPERGRLRDYLKAALRNLVHDYYRRQPPSAEALPTDSQLPCAPDSDDEDFSEIWTSEVMIRAWSALRSDSAMHRNNYFDALKLKGDHPDARAEDLAKLLNQQLGTQYNDATIRQMLRRGRERFAAFLRDAVRDSLPADEADQVDRELADLGLLVYMSVPRT